MLVFACLQVSADDVQLPLTDTPGRTEEGEKIFHDRNLGHCLLCHSLSASAGTFQGTLAPSLDDVGSRLSAGQIRFRIVDQSRLNQATTMPPYFRFDRLNQVAAEFQNSPVLTAQQIEDLVAYLGSQQQREIAR